MKRIICFLLCIMMIIPLVVMQTTADDFLPFSDVSEDDASYTAIKTMYDDGYMSGVSSTTFGKDTLVSRAMICLIGAKIAKADLSTSDKSYFDDVPTGKWYTAAINWAYENKIASGTSATTFSPNNDVTLEQAITILYKIATVMELDLSYEDMSFFHLCADFDSVASYAQKPLAWALNYGIVCATDGKLSPKKFPTREDVAVIFYNFLNYDSANFIEPPVVHTVRFFDWNGTLLDTKYVIDGEDASYTKVAPFKMNEDNKYYFFDGWGRELTSITEDVDFVANYVEKVFPFKDVPTNHWAYSSTVDNYFDGYLSGVSSNLFGGANTVTRAMLVTVCAKIAGLTFDNSVASKFSDVPKDKWYTGAVSWANDNGIVSGNTDGTFKPNSNVTREQATLILRNLLKYLGHDVSLVDDCYLKLFYDWDKVSSYAHDSLGWATIYEVMGGSNNKINPKNSLTRYELSVIIRRVLNYDSATHKPHIDVIHVKFVNWNSTLLQDGYSIVASEKDYRGATPKRPDDDTYTYKFNGWKKSGSTGDVVFTATYKATEIPRRRIDPNKPMIAITFDDGPGAGSTSILNTLEKYGVVATFFDIGYNIVRYPDVIRREVALGCEIGNHTYNHPNLNTLSATQIRNEINQNYNAYKNILGYGPTLCRPPYGNANTSVRPILAGMGYRIVHWSVDTLDWKSRNANSVYNIAMNDAFDGAIILMHSLYPSTADAVARIVPALINRGYQLVTVSELAKYKGYSFKADGTMNYSFK